MLSQFNNEVLSYGPTAVLPQNLNSSWIMKLQKAAEDERSARGQERYPVTHVVLRAVTNRVTVTGDPPPGGV